VALFERFTICSAKKAGPIDGKASNQLRYTLSVAVCKQLTIWKNSVINVNTITIVFWLLKFIAFPMFLLLMAIYDTTEAATL